MDQLWTTLIMRCLCYFRWCILEYVCQGFSSSSCLLCRDLKYNRYYFIQKTIDILRNDFTGLHQGIDCIRYFLSLMRTPILLVFAHAYHAFCLQIEIRPECERHGVHIQVHLHRNAYYAWANNKRMGVHIQDRIYLNRCTPFLDVSLWFNFKQ